MTKYAGRQLTLAIGAAGGTIIGQVVGLGHAGSSRDLIDASAYGDDWKDYVVGQQDGSDLEVEVAYDPANAQHGALLTAYNAGTSTHFTMVHTGASFSVQWDAKVTKIERGGDRDGLLSMSVSMKILSPGVSNYP